MDAQGKRVRESAPDAQNHEEAKTYREDKRRQVREQRNLKPGEVLACHDTFADVADKYLAYQKPRLTAEESFEREEGIVDDLKALFAGRLADITSSQVSDLITERLGKVSKSSVRKEFVHPQAPLPAGLRGVEASAPFRQSVRGRDSAQGA